MFDYNPYLQNKLNAHLRKAREKGLPATLTRAEWYKTEKFFGYLCAYCQKRVGKVIEHFIPLKCGGGTTVGNCVPSCQSCNAIKANRHPDDITDERIIAGIDRVRVFLVTCGR